MSLNSRRPLALIILDGWGVSTRSEGHAIAQARTPYYDEIRERFPSTTLSLPGPAMGSPAQWSAGAEIGHRIIGAGRLLETDAAQVAEAVSTGAILNNEVLISAFVRAAAAAKPVHLIGLLSDGGVHSSQDTLFALLRMAKLAGVREAFVHGILDGRDARPRTADIYVEALEIKMADIGLGRIASLCGRFYAMDSSEHWERTARAYTMLVHGEGERGFDAVTAVRSSFLRGISDEFISPLVLEKAPDEPVATVQKDDIVIFFNHKGDGMRQLVRSIAVPGPGSPRPRVDAVCLTEYDPEFYLPVAFGKPSGGSYLAEIFETQGVKNYRITETSRSAHISTLFNGPSRLDNGFERDIFLPTAGPETLDAEPESKSFKIADTVIRGLNAGRDGVFVVNFPASALLAEAGNLAKTIESVQFVDTCLGGVVEKILDLNGVALITASHAGCEQVRASRFDPVTANFSNSVPFHLIDAEGTNLELAPDGSLADVAPTVLGMLGIDRPAEMTGRDLRV